MNIQIMWRSMTYQLSLILFLSQASSRCSSGNIALLPIEQHLQMLWQFEEAQIHQIFKSSTQFGFSWDMTWTKEFSWYFPCNNGELTVFLVLASILYGLFQFMEANLFQLIRRSVPHSFARHWIHHEESFARRKGPMSIPSLRFQDILGQ